MQVPKSLVAAIMVLGAGLGSYGIASAAGGSSGSSSVAAPAASAPAPPPGSGRPWGRQRSDETPLSREALAKVTAVAQAKVPGGTVVRVETDADGHAAYEAHMTKSDGTPVTVYVDKSFDFVSVETR
jgi:hypothetical protein